MKAGGRGERRRSNPEKTRSVWVRRGIRRYKIPIDAQGFVPIDAMVQRLQKAGGVQADLDDHPSRVLPQKCTPQMIIDWWADPSSCDIDGIDTEDSPMYDVSGLKGQDMRDVQRKFAVISPDPDEAKRIRKILSESFTVDELRQMTNDGALIIRTVPNMGDATGCYLRKQDGIDVPLILIEKNTTPDGIVHEVVHHARAVDETRDGVLKTTIPTTPTGKFDKVRMLLKGRRKAEEIIEEEERQTVAETVVRTKTDRNPSGYYDGVPGRVDPRTAYVDDRRILTGTSADVPEKYIPRLKGESAKRAVEKGYSYTNVARAEILGRSTEKKTKNDRVMKGKR